MKKFFVALISALISLPVLADVTGLVTPPGGSGASLPSQTGNSGKFLTTDGTSASWASPTASASSITPGTTTVVGSTAPCLIDNSATTVMGCLAETGTGSAVLATSPTLVTPNLGTPSAINLTNATALPATALPALTGDVTSSAGSNSVTVSKVNGAIPTASAAIAATNSSSQIIAATTTGTGTTAVLATSPSLTTPLVAGYATASLPTCNSASKGALAYTTDGTPAFTFCNGTSWVSAGGTTFTVAGTGCTPTAATGSATAGTFTLAAGPCTAVTITFNGAVGMTAPNGWHCDVGDRTLQAAGTWFGEWPENSSTTTTATIGIPAAAGTTDVISFRCTEF